MGLIEDIKLYRIYSKEKPDLEKLKEAIRMNGTKPWWQSETIWAGVLAVISGAIPLIDKNFGTHIASNPLFGVFMSIVGGFVIHGRVTAQATLTTGGPSTPPTTGG